MIHSVLKTNPWTYKNKDWNGKKMIKVFYEKKSLLIGLKSTVVLDLKNYATKIELDHDTDDNTYWFSC